MSHYVSQSDAEARLGIADAIKQLHAAEALGNEPTHVYIVRVDPFLSPVKIGIAKDLKGRLRELQTGNHHRLGIFASFLLPCRELAQDIERLTHERFKTERRRGEWFDVQCRDAVAWIKALAESVS